MDNIPVKPSEAKTKVIVATEEIGNTHYPVYHPFGLQIAKKKVLGHTVGTIFGHNDDLDPANAAMIWDYGEFQPVEEYLTADTELFMSSSSAADTNVGILIFGMTDDYAYKTELHTHTAGQTQHSVGNWFRVFEMKVVAGSPAAGDIYFTESDTLTLGVPNTPAKVHAKMHQGTGTTHKAAHTVPAGHTLMATRMFLGTRRAEDCVFSFYFKTPTMPAFIESSDFPIYQNNAFLVFDPPFPITEKIDFYFLGTTVTNNTQPSANIGYTLVDNSV